jgi:hypothetical protein
MRRCLFIGLLVFPGCTDTLKSNPFRVSVDVAEGYATLDGKWQSTSGRSTGEVPSINAVHVECERRPAVCTEFLARMITKEEDPLGGGPYLFANVIRYRVLEWSDSHIVARAEPRAADVELRIAILDKSAERTSRETGARGGVEADPLQVDHWALK